MTGAQALDMVMLRLVRTDSALRAALLLEMNQLIHTRLEKGNFVPWFLFQENTSAVTAIGVETVTLPTGFIRFEDSMEIGGVSYLDATLTTPDQYVELTRGALNNIRRLYADSTTDTPKRYDIVGLNLYLRPIPDEVLPLKIGAMFADADVADSTDTTLWLTNASDLVVAETTLIGATLYTRDSALVEIAMAERNVSLTRLKAAHIAFMESMQERKMGED